MSPSPVSGRATTLSDIAEHVGVSKVAASVVLNNSRSQVRVSAATRQRILDAAKELKYQPNALARSLMRQRTNIMGFHSEQGKMFNPLYPFFGSILKGLLQGCEFHEKNILIHGAFSNRSEDEVFLELLNGQIDGLVLYAREVTPLVERLIDSRLPVVTVADEVPGLPCVMVDDEQGGRLLASYLAGRGYKTVLYRVIETDLPSSIKLRLNGFVSEAEKLGMQVEVYQELGEYPGERDREIILSRENRPDVIATFSDYSADNLALFCRQNGVKIPEELAITGFDGIFSALHPATSLTTILAPWDEVARTAVAHLVAQCNGEEVPMHTRLPIQLVVGDTA
jgi:DNA-binding LacI/PurR family transcriptional regulator